MLTQEIKDRASYLQDNGKWYELIKLLLQIGYELVQYLRERKKEKKRERGITITNKSNH